MPKQFTQQEREKATAKVDALPVWNDDRAEWRSHAIDLQCEVNDALSIMRLLSEQNDNASTEERFGELVTEHVMGAVWNFLTRNAETETK